jgi:uncharacterized membrane protein (UPF0127 family)
MHRRFRRARRATVDCPAGALEVAVAERYRNRLVGLARLEDGEIEPLLLPRCRSIHTFGMKAPIDVVWLDGERVLGVVADLRPRRHARAPRGASRDVSALELAAGQAERLGFLANATPPNS